MAAGWDPTSGGYPLPPSDGAAVSAYLPGVTDLRWDNPSILSGNTAYHVVGVNIYRSDSSDRGPYYRINEFPVGSGFYRDRTDIQFVRETVQWDHDWIFQGNKPNNRQFQLRTKRRIVKQFDAAPYDKPTFGNTPGDVTLYIDDVEVPVHDVFGRGGEVTLINQAAFNVITEKLSLTLPTADSTVVIEYWAPKNYVASGLDQWTWYRLTTVVIDPNTPSGYTETPLNQSRPLSTAEVESMDYIWEEAVRRNQWILGCGGERVKLFIKKHCGTPCDCTREDTRMLEYSKQPENNCLACYGTGFVGGYDGPFDIIIAPDDSERSITQTSFGKTKKHAYEVWTGPTPLLTMRDFIVKQTNERYSVGAVRRPSHRGTLLQQHFPIGYLDEGDVRYRVPIDGTANLPWPETRPKTGEPAPVYPRMPVTGERSYDQDEGWAGPTYPEGADAVTPLQTEKGSVPDHNEKRGRTKVWENTNYGISPISLYLMYELAVEICKGVLSWFL